MDEDVIQLIVVEAAGIGSELQRGGFACLVLICLLQILSDESFR